MTVALLPRKAVAAWVPFVYSTNGSVPFLCIQESVSLWGLDSYITTWWRSENTATNNNTCFISLHWPKKSWAETAAGIRTWAYCKTAISVYYGSFLSLHRYSSIPITLAYTYKVFFLRLKRQHVAGACFTNARFLEYQHVSANFCLSAYLQTQMGLGVGSMAWYFRVLRFNCIWWIWLYLICPRAAAIRAPQTKFQAWAQLLVFGHAKAFFKGSSLLGSSDKIWLLWCVC